MKTAEKVNYWQTSRTSPDGWLEKAKREIVRVDGVMIGEGFVSDTNRSTYLLAFQIGDNKFRIVWPVLEPKGGNVRAARVQAATALYHEVKAACVKAKFLGTRTAFFAFLMIPDGRTAAEMSTPEIADVFPSALAAPREDPS
jgi:hypothetical protein